MIRDASLQVELIGSVAVMFLAVFLGIVYLNISQQGRQLKEEVQDAAVMLADTLYSGMITPM